MRRGCQQAEEQLKQMLIDYQNEYRSNLNIDMGNGIASNPDQLSAVYSDTGKGDRAASPPAYVRTQSRPRAEELARKAATSGPANLTGPTKPRQRC